MLFLPQISMSEDKDQFFRSMLPSSRGNEGGLEEKKPLPTLPLPLPLLLPPPPSESHTPPYRAAADFCATGPNSEADGLGSCWKEDEECRWWWYWL